MSLGQRLMGERRGHADDGSGGHITRPRVYEIAGALGFLGQRRRVYDGLVAAAGIRLGDAVCDIGCGTGYLSRRVALAVGPAGRVTGVDPSAPVIAYARRAAPPNAQFVVAGGEQVPLPDAGFDVVVSSLAIHHIPPQLRGAAMREMARLVRPGGRLFVADFRPPRPGFANSLVAKLSGHAMAHNPIGELAAIVTAAGFTVVAEGDRWPMLHYVRAVAPS
ncbi:MAG: class I SAM-dependent methyltransferase [Hamadaea sp.]|nr:class I SAM-dependent methyltransferase [Hamadaea sp.]